MQGIVDAVLRPLAEDFFIATKLDITTKKRIFSAIHKGIEDRRTELLEVIVDEVKLTHLDANKEINRAHDTFKFATNKADYVTSTHTAVGDKIIFEKRLARGPLLAITPFSSPLSSAAHKISMGLLAGTSVLFKPSPLALRSGRLLYEIIKKATDNKYVYFCDSTNEEVLSAIVADERVGIVSFTGSYEIGKKIIQIGGVKKYHMELSGGNAPIIFSPDFENYDEQLVNALLDGITAKNGQRCVSVKHLFLPIERIDFIRRLQEKLQALKDQTTDQLTIGQPTELGPLITQEYAKKAEQIVEKILHVSNDIESYIELERKGAYVLPSMYVIKQIESSFVQKVFAYDVPGPVVFVHFYNNKAEYDQIFTTLKHDYVRSGLQLSVYLGSETSPKTIVEDLLWGGIIFNDIPTFRHDAMSFGGFGRSGLGKEGWFETLQMYTDPQTIVYPKGLFD